MMGDVNDRPPVKRRRSRSSSVQRMLDLEKKIRSQALFYQPALPAVGKPWQVRQRDEHRVTGREPARPPPNGSYSSRARVSTGTAAANASRMAIALATAPPNLESSHDPVSSNPQTPTWDPQEGDKDWKKAADKAAKAAKRASAQRLVKPPPSASRTPHLMARQPAPGPPTTGYSSQSERSSSYGPPDHASIDQGSRRSRRRSDSVNSITSVSSIASKIKASFDRPRGGALPRVGSPGSRNASRNASRLSIDTMSLNGGPGPRPRTSEGLLNARPRTGDSLGGAGLSDMAALSAVLKSIDLAEDIEEVGKTPEKVEVVPKQPLEKPMSDTKRRSTLPAENGTPFRDAAKAAFHIRSPSAARGRSASVASGQLSPIGPIAASGQTSPFPGLSGVTTPVPAETPAATEPSDPWSSAKADTADARSRPPLAHQNNTTRGADRSSASVSSYDTAHSHHLSTVTPNTSRPESERGIVAPLVADDGRKFLLGRDRSGSPAITRPLAAVGARNAPTPPPGPMNGRRIVRVSSGGDILANGTASLRPKAESTTWPLKPESSNQEIDAEWTQVSAPLKQQSNHTAFELALFRSSKEAGG
ncbi:unnamed protein product [Parascedosporium putredinis]|uniref:Uncharacterized protein n=1 Tax=Parascedosporium putredinis TaxID=1442378 RepID=A0A9P1HB05_9PEZI|nr:unnamed protein product [Parascedosporium putredinis]CAI8003396.1 unnamed protein product [Parascedosporium putredinis]